MVQAVITMQSACVVGLSEAMLGSGPWQLGETGQRYMKTIKTSSLHLASLINDILGCGCCQQRQACHQA